MWESDRRDHDLSRNLFNRLTPLYSDGIAREKLWS